MSLGTWLAHLILLCAILASATAIFDPRAHFELGKLVAVRWAHRTVSEPSRRQLVAIRACGGVAFTIFGLIGVLRVAAAMA